MQKMLCGNFSESLEKRIELEDVDKLYFCQLLDLWCDKGSKAARSVKDVLILAGLADRLHMTEVGAALEQAILNQLQLEVCAEVLMGSKESGLFRVEEVAHQLAAERFEEFSGTEGFLKLDENTLACLLDDDTLTVTSEMLVFEALVAWMESGDGAELRGRELLRKVRFPQIEENSLREDVHRVFPAEHVDWIADLVAEGWKAKQAVRSGSAFQPRLLQANALAPRRGNGISWERTGVGDERRLHGHRGGVLALAECGGRVYSGSLDGSIRVWDRRALAAERTLHDDPDDIVAALAAWGGRLFSGHRCGLVRVWNLATGECEQRLEGHAGRVEALAACGAVLASGSRDASVRLWATGDGPGLASPYGPAGPWRCCRALVGHQGPVLCLVAAHGRVVSGSLDCTIRVWNTETGDTDAVLRHEDAVRGLAAHGGRLYSVSEDGTVRSWAAGSWAALRAVQACNPLSRQYLCCAAVCGLALVTGMCNPRYHSSAELWVWDLTTLQLRRRIQHGLQHGQDVTCLTAAGGELWTGMGLEVAVWGWRSRASDSGPSGVLCSQS